MANNPLQTDSYFQSLRMAHAAQLIGLIALLAVVRFIFLDEEVIEAAVVNSLLIQYTPVAITTLGVLTGLFLYKRRVKRAQKAPNLTAKLSQYRGACLARWTAITASAILTIFWFMVYADKFFMAIALINMALLAFARPAPSRAANSLNLSPEEQEIIEEPGF